MVLTSNSFLNLMGFLLGMVNIQGITLWPFIIVRPGLETNPVLLNHERIHLRQQQELLVLPFYGWYLMEFLLRGYYRISFEREAYAHDKDLTYLRQRPRYAFFRYLNPPV